MAALTSCPFAPSPSLTGSGCAPPGSGDATTPAALWTLASPSCKPRQWLRLLAVNPSFESVRSGRIRSTMSRSSTSWIRSSSKRDLRAEVVCRRTDEHGTGIEEMVQDIDDARDSDDEMEESAKAFNEMLESSKRPLHEHTELCQLDAIAQVMALKAQFHLGRECYDAMMKLFGRFLPKGHVTHANLYQSDKILRVLKMPYEKIVACEN